MPMTTYQKWSLGAFAFREKWEKNHLLCFSICGEEPCEYCPKVIFLLLLINLSPDPSKKLQMTALFKITMILMKLLIRKLYTYLCCPPLSKPEGPVRCKRRLVTDTKNRIVVGCVRLFLIIIIINNKISKNYKKWPKSETKKERLYGAHWKKWIVGQKSGFLNHSLSTDDQRTCSSHQREKLWKQKSTVFPNKH